MPDIGYWYSMYILSYYILRTNLDEIQAGCVEVWSQIGGQSRVNFRIIFGVFSPAIEYLRLKNQQKYFIGLEKGQIHYGMH